MTTAMLEREIKLQFPSVEEARAAVVAAGAVVSVPLYVLLLEAYTLGSPEFPAPTAVRWRALAELAGQVDRAASGRESRLRPGERLSCGPWRSTGGYRRRER